LGNENGSSVVEVAIILPLILALTFGPIFINMAQRTQMVLDTAAREGARDFAKSDNVSRAVSKAKKELQIGGVNPNDTTINAIRNGYERQVKIEMDHPMMIPFVGLLDPKLRGSATFHVESTTTYW